jgi:hypothetical protein
MNLQSFENLKSYCCEASQPTDYCGEFCLLGYNAMYPGEVPVKYRLTSNGGHSFRAQMIEPFIVTAVRTSHPIQITFLESEVISLDLFNIFLY